MTVIPVIVGIHGTVQLSMRQDNTTGELSVYLTHNTGVQV